LHPAWITTSLRLQFQESVYVSDKVPSFASLRVVLRYLVLLKFVDF
jgi:hypothetical protein